MLAPISDCITVEKCAVIRFLWSEGVKSSKIHTKMLAQHGENCFTQRKVYQRVVGQQALLIKATQATHPPHE
jgi:hypothetical protein